MTGIVFGLICGVAVYLLSSFGLEHLGNSSIENGLIVGMGVCGACLASTFLGVSAPLFFARLGVDPAVASGPIVTAFNDVFSMMIYFIISGLISSLLF
jgi:magnesium transporter